MKRETLIRAAAGVILTAASALSIGGCLVSSNPNGYYHPTYATYGYTTAAAPNTAYYNGGYHNNVYYRPGYYYNSAPFIQSSPTVYAAPTTYARPAGVYVGGSVATPVVGVGGGAGVGVAMPRVGVSIP